MGATQITGDQMDEAFGREGKDMSREKVIRTGGRELRGGEKMAGRGLNESVKSNLTLHIMYIASFA